MTRHGGSSMRHTVTDNFKIIAVAAVTAMVTAGGPPAVAAAYNAINADTVDGKHAVWAGASLDKRSGKLVATNETTGRLPNNIISRAPDAARLGGRAPGYFMPRSSIHYVSVSASGAASMRSSGTIRTRGVSVGVYEVKLPNTETCVVSLTLANGNAGTYGFVTGEFSDEPEGPYTVYTRDRNGDPAARQFDLIALC